MYWIYDINQHFGVQFIYGWWWFQPLWKIWKSDGMIIYSQYDVKNKNHVPNHQPDKCRKKLYKGYPHLGDTAES